MKNRRFRILTLLFAIIMMFSTTSVYAQESATVRAVSRTISKDTVYSGTLAAGETHTYYFTPSYTGLFTVETFGTTDTYGTMSGNSVTTFPATASNDDGGEGVPMNNTATATAKETVRRPAPAAPSSAGRMTRRVGNTTYRVTLHFKENGKEDMNDKIRRLIKMGCEG
mgnify:CR=1 FL=1